MQTGGFKFWSMQTDVDGNTEVFRFFLHADSTNPQLDVGTMQAEAIDASSLLITGPEGLDASGVLQYQLERNGVALENWQTSVTLVDSGLLPNTVYNYRMQVKDSSPDRRTSTWSASVSARTLAANPGNT